MDEALTEFLTQTITVEPFTGPDGFGAPAYGAAVTFSPQETRGGARVKRESKLVRGLEGEEVLSNASVLLDGAAGIPARSRVTLPDGTVSTVLAVEDAPDEKGATYFTRLRLQ
jgi:hypothetical protein